MEMVAAVEGGAQPVGSCRVAHRLVEVDDAVEGVARANPLVQSLAPCFLLGVEEAGYREAVERGQRRAKDLDAAVVRAPDQLLHGRDQLVDARGFGEGRQGGA